MHCVKSSKKIYTLQWNPGLITISDNIYSMVIVLKTLNVLQSFYINVFDVLIIFSKINNDSVMTIRKIDNKINLYIIHFYDFCIWNMSDLI